MVSRAKQPSRPCRQDLRWRDRLSDTHQRRNHRCFTGLWASTAIIACDERFIPAVYDRMAPRPSLDVYEHCSSNHEAHHNIADGLLCSRSGARFNEKCGRVYYRCVARFHAGAWNTAACCISCHQVGVHSGQAQRTRCEYLCPLDINLGKEFTDEPCRLPDAIEHTNSQTLKHALHATSCSHPKDPMLARIHAQQTITVLRNTATHHRQDVPPLNTSESPATALYVWLQGYRSYRRYMTHHVTVPRGRTPMNCLSNYWRTLGRHRSPQTVHHRQFEVTAHKTSGMIRTVCHWGLVGTTTRTVREMLSTERDRDQ